jgi:hypothetical protein
MSKSQSLQLCCAWEHLPVLWRAMGVTAAEDEAIAAAKNPARKRDITRHFHARRYLMTCDVEQMAALYSKMYIRPIPAADRKLLKRLLAIRASECKLWRQLDPSIHRAVDLAGFFIANPDVPKSKLISHFEDNLDTFKDDLEERLTSHNQCLEFLLNDRGRSRIERKFVIEPFLQFMQNHGITPSRKFPLKGMLKALYLVLGIGNPPSDVAVRQIVSDLKKRASQRKRPES